MGEGGGEAEGVLRREGAVRDEAAVYGSGGFTSYSLERLAEQLGGWAAEGIPRVKMKVGRNPDEDPVRLETARLAIGEATELFVDANGAYDRDEAVEWAHRYADEWDVRWFEEPVTSADFAGLRLVREQAKLDVVADRRPRRVEALGIPLRLARDLHLHAQDALPDPAG